jgi:hypothetical protein
VSSDTNRFYIMQLLESDAEQDVAIEAVDPAKLKVVKSGFEAMTVAELRAALADAELPAAGKKAELIARLRDCADVEEPRAAEEGELDDGAGGPQAAYEALGGEEERLAFLKDPRRAGQLVRRRRWWLFTKQGRVGTEIGGTGAKEYPTRALAKAAFEAKYRNETKNEWAGLLAGEAFVKRPGGLFPVERLLDEGGGGAAKLASVQASAQSKLDPRVQALMALIFDVQLMEDSMNELDIDLEKMPLGKLQKSQITSGYAVLTQVPRRRAVPLSLIPCVPHHL